MSKLRAFRTWNAILNIHERVLPVTFDAAGRLLDSLASRNDLLWPGDRWPPMLLDRGLAVGSAGGHSMIRYAVSEYVPGRRAEFTFAPMTHLGRFAGRHYFEVVPREGHVVLRHTIDVETNLRTWIYWKLFIERIHDAVVEDAFDKAERNAGVAHPHTSSWSPYVRLLRWWRKRHAR